MSIASLSGQSPAPPPRAETVPVRPEGPAANPASPTTPAAGATPPPTATDPRSSQDDSGSPRREPDTFTRTGPTPESTPGDSEAQPSGEPTGDAATAESTSEPQIPSAEPELTEAEQKQVAELKARDQEVRVHEEAHKAAAGELFRGGPNYEYQTGPDGKKYAVGGNVQIDTSEGRTPEETIARAQKMVRAALAPAEPSGQDRSVAAKARRLEAEARRELTEQQLEEQAEQRAEANGESEESGANDASSVPGSDGRTNDRPADRPDRESDPSRINRGDPPSETPTGARARRAYGSTAPQETSAPKPDTDASGVSPRPLDVTG